MREEAEGRPLGDTIVVGSSMNESCDERKSQVYQPKELLPMVSFKPVENVVWWNKVKSGKMDA